MPLEEPARYEARFAQALQAQACGVCVASLPQTLQEPLNRSD